MTLLPSIVEAAESSPQAAAAAAYQVRKFLSKDHYLYPYKQYNAVMLIRILVDHPGKPFTKNIDEKFKETVKWLLKMSRDPSVQQIMRETLDSFEQGKKDDENLKPLLKMWEKEKKTMPKMQYSGPSQAVAGRGMYQNNWQQGSSQRAHSNGRPKYALPNPEELSGRIEEARTSAKLLIQLVQSTPPAELDNNDLIKEFAERCQSAQRSLHGYMNCTDPAPDEPTLETLIETNEQLSLACSKHQRALLGARRQTSQANVARQNAEVLYDRTNPDYNARLPHQSQTQQPMASPSQPPPPNPVYSQQQQLHPASAFASANTSPAMQQNPFSDANQIHHAPPSLHSANQSSSGQHPQANHLSTNAQSYRPIPPIPGHVELPGASTPPAPEDGFDNRQIDSTTVPPRQDTPPSNSYNDHDDLYGTSPVAPRQDHTLSTSVDGHRPVSSGLYSADDGPYQHHRGVSRESNGISQLSTARSFEPMQSSLNHSGQHDSGYANNTNFQTSQPPSSRKPVGGWGEAETPTREHFEHNGTLGSSRMKDDEPMTPALGVSGAGWHY